jgi:hypothetical protein
MEEKQCNPYDSNILRLDKLPLDKDKVHEYLSKFSEDNIVVLIDYKDCDFESPFKFLNYCSNCGIKRMIVTGSYTELEDVVVAYMKFDRIIDIPNFNELITSILFEDDTRTTILDNNFKDIVQSMKDKHSDLLEDARSYFYSLHMIISSIIAEEDKDLRDKINSLEKTTLKSGLSNNIVNIRTATQFIRYIYHLDETMTWDDIRQYKEFDIPMFDGNTVISYMLNTFIPYKVMCMYNSMTRDPKWAKEEFEKAKKLIDEEDKE